VTGAPNDATGLCKDGTYTKEMTKSGACAKHGGVKTRFQSESLAAVELTPSRTV
jgi:hypothetical protein